MITKFHEKMRIIIIYSYHFKMKSLDVEKALFFCCIMHVFVLIISLDTL